MTEKLFTGTLNNNQNKNKKRKKLQVYGAYSIYSLLTVYRKIFGTSSYGEGCTSLRVHLRNLNECRIFYNIQSITFLLYTFVKREIRSNLRLVVIVPCIPTSFRPFILPQMTSKPLLTTAVKYDFNAHAKLRLLA